MAQEWIPRLARHALVLGTVAMFATVVRGQDFTPSPPLTGGPVPVPWNQQPGPGPAFPYVPNQEPGFPPGSNGNGPGSGLPAPPNPQPGLPPGLNGNGPARIFPVPPNQQPGGPPMGPSGNRPGPAPPVPQIQQLGPGAPPTGPAIWPLPIPAAAELPPVADGPKATGIPGDEGGATDMSFGSRGGMMGGFGMAGGMHPVDSVRYSALWTPSVPVEGQSTNFETIREDLSFTHPLWVDPLNALSVTGGIRSEIIDTGAVLPGVGVAVPSDLWGINLGLHYNRQLNDGWMAGGGLSVGSESDHPFAGLHEMNVGMNAMLRIPSGEHDAWLFTLAYSPMGELAFPVPGVAYLWNPSPQFHASIGLPLMVLWRPTEDWQIQASYMLLRTIHIKSQYRVTRWLRAFAAYDWTNESYILLDSPDANDRFFIYDQRVSLGLETSFLQHFTASVSGGLIFDRYMFEAATSTSTTADRVELGNGPFAGLNLGARY